MTSLDTEVTPTCEGVERTLSKHRFLIKTLSSPDGTRSLGVLINTFRYLPTHSLGLPERIYFDLRHTFDCFHRSRHEVKIKN